MVRNWRCDGCGRVEPAMTPYVLRTPDGSDWYFHDFDCLERFAHDMNPIATTRKVTTSE